MNNKEKLLTKSELDLMELFWEQERPLTSVEVLEIKGERSWNGSYIHIMLRSIMKKGMIQVCGAIQYGTQYARQFIPVVTKEEYAARLALSTGISKDELGKVVFAMVKESVDEGSVSEMIEEIILALKDSKKRKTSR